jgi:hypothetical protein
MYKDHFKMKMFYVHRTVLGSLNGMDLNVVHIVIVTSPSFKPYVVTVCNLDQCKPCTPHLAESTLEFLPSILEDGRSSYFFLQSMDEWVPSFRESK